jgi:hypothetical protein
MASATKTGPAPRHKNRKLFWIGAAAALLCMVSAALWFYHSDAGFKERLRQKVRTELPVGSNREQVEKWAQRQLGRDPSLQIRPNVRLPQRTLEDAAGVPESEQCRYVMLTIPMESRFISGKWASNHMWVFLPLNESGEVTGHYFLTLDELAQIEANDRNQAK